MIAASLATNYCNNEFCYLLLSNAGNLAFLHTACNSWFLVDFFPRSWNTLHSDQDLDKKSRKYRNFFDKETEVPSFSGDKKGQSVYRQSNLFCMLKILPQSQIVLHSGFQAVNSEHSHISCKSVISGPASYLVAATVNLLVVCSEYLCHRV